MPVFPSQDGPLHLYYVNVFRDLLRHAQGAYSSTYYIGRYLPPYSLYYYGLIALGSLFSLQAADKIIVCIFLFVFGLGVRRLMQVVSGPVTWAPALILPVLLNWPLLMGFVNYALATGLACFALSVWFAGRSNPSIWPRVRFLLLLTGVILTHPVPWMLVIAFLFFDLAVRAARRRLDRAAKTVRSILLDLATAVVSCSGFIFLRSFRNMEGAGIHAIPSAGPFLQAMLDRLSDYRHGYGLALFVGGGTLVHLQRLLYLPAVLTLVTLAAAALFRASAHDRETRATWSLFALGFLLAFPFIPADLNGSYFFAMRLMFLVYTCLAVAASARLASRRFALPVAGAFTAFGLFTLLLAHRLISPVAREIAVLNSAPAVPAGHPGLIVWPETNTTGQLAFGPLQWAGAGYLRQHNAVLYNTTWLELAIIPIKVRPQALKNLDTGFSIVPPRIPPKARGLFATPELMERTLGRVGYVVGAHGNDVPGHDLLTSRSTATAGWQCSQTGDWQVCTPVP